MKLLLLISFVCIASALSCYSYIMTLAAQAVINKTLVLNELAPYLLLSGKTIEDLGFPDTCITLPDANFITAQFTSPQQGYNVTIYYGLCFNNQCTAADFNQNPQLAMEYIANFTSVYVPSGTTAHFVQPRLQMQSSVVAIIMWCLFAVLLLTNILYSVKRWVGMCSESQPVSVQPRYSFYEDGELVNEPVDNSFLRKISFYYKFQTYIFGKPYRRDKILSFSIFKIFCVPMFIFGQEFYYRNFGAYNYYAFTEYIYETFYSKVAMFSAYLPDTLFFISGYLLSTKCLQLDVLEPKHIAQFLGRKLYRLYPTYLAMLIIFALITPSCHAGPVWYVYEDQAALCKQYWWSSLLLFGNWFSRQCFAGGWFVEAEMQLVLFCLIFFFVYSRYKRLGLGIYVFLLIAMAVLTFVFAPNMPTTLGNILSLGFFQAYTATYSYLLFYMLGMGVALLKTNQEVNYKITEAFEKSYNPDIIMAIIALCLCFLILFRPSVWASASGIEFTLCRIGAWIAFFCLFAGGIWKPEEFESSTRAHNVAHYTYPIMIISPIVTLASVWCAGSLSFVSGLNQLNLLVAELFICVISGTVVSILIEYRFEE